MADLPTILRPNGKTYRPRKIVTHKWENEWPPNYDCGVVVVGTHDLDRARPLADEAIALWFDDRLMATKPEPGWYRLGFRYGEQIWVEDEVHGRAGVMFTAGEEVRGG